MSNITLSSSQRLAGTQAVIHAVLPAALGYEDDTQRTAATSRHASTAGTQEGVGSKCGQLGNSQRRAVSQGTQVVNLIATIEVEILQGGNELQPANACIRHVAAREHRGISGHDSSAGSSRPSVACNPEVEILQCGNELQPANACIRHAGAPEVEYLQGARVAQAAHVRQLREQLARVRCSNVGMSSSPRMPASVTLRECRQLRG
jgi:hypothetical protein